MITTNDLEQLLQKVDSQGWGLIDLTQYDPEFVNSLLQYHILKEQQGLLKPATITQDSANNKNIIRNDQTFWLDFQNEAEKYIQSRLDIFLQALRQYFRMGLTHYESHLAFYPAGHYYKTHSDQTLENNKRFFSFVIYLNKDWTESLGGQISGYSDFTENNCLFEIIPEYGKMILFQSHIPHEVKISHANRRSLTGWFRT